MEDLKCISTKVKIANEEGSVMFPCPKCGKHTIIRSSHARAISAPYKCPECGFVGP